MPQGILSEEGKLSGALSPIGGLSGELAPFPTLSGALTLPAEVNGRNYKTFLMHDWDFAAGLTDRIQGVKAIIGGDAVKQSDGIHFSTHKDYILLNITFEYNRTYEIDFGEMNRRANGDQHGRIFMPLPDMGIMYRMTLEWGIWGNGADDRPQWANISGLTDPNVFQNKTMKIFIDIDGSVSVYLDGKIFMKTNINIPRQGSICIGSMSWQSFYLMTVRGFREYYGFYE